VPLATTRGKTAALIALDVRRAANRDRIRIDNASLPAGSPMYFDCINCGDSICVPEDYLVRPQLCRECTAMKNLGWLE
jgi:hypothetical protein